FRRQIRTPLRRRFLNALHDLVNLADRHADHLGDRGDGHPLRPQPDELFGVDLHPRAPKPCTTTTSPFEPRSGALTNAKTLLLGDPTEDSDQQRPHRSTRIKPRLFDAHDLNATAIKIEDD